MPPKRKAKAKPKVKYIDQIVQTEETKQVKINQNIVVCDKCNHKIPVQNEVQIDKKGVKLKCLPCSFKISRKSKTTSDSSKKDGEEEILSSTEEKSYAMAFNRDITNESNREHRRAITDWTQNF